jgi:hypothetical protein
MTKKKHDNSKQYGAFVLNFEHLNFDIVSDFDIRISDLLVLILVTFGTGNLFFITKKKNSCPTVRAMIWQLNSDPLFVDGIHMIFF